MKFPPFTVWDDPPFPALCRFAVYISFVHQCGQKLADGRRQSSKEWGYGFHNLVNKTMGASICSLCGNMARLCLIMCHLWPHGVAKKKMM